MEHLGLTSFRAVLRHAFGHGRGLMQCTERHDMNSVIGVPKTPWNAVWLSLVVYPVYGVTTKIQRLWRYAPMLFPDLVKSLPVILPALIATGAGALAEWAIARRTTTRLARNTKASGDSASSRAGAIHELSPSHQAVVRRRSPAPTSLRSRIRSRPGP
jgi:hypothetical protein